MFNNLPRPTRTGDYLYFAVIRSLRYFPPDVFAVIWHQGGERTPKRGSYGKRQEIPQVK